MSTAHEVMQTEMRRPPSKAPTIPALRPEPRRNEYGHYILPDPRTGVETAWTRATTVAKALDDTYNLNQWQRRMVAIGMAQLPTLAPLVTAAAEAIAEAGDDWRAAKSAKEALNALCDQAAMTAGAGDGADWGTALHALTEWLDAGRIAEIEVPIECAADLAAYEVAMREAGITCPPEYIERIVVNTTIGTAGTLDRFGYGPWHGLRVIDLKTQKDVYDYLAMVIQLSEYVHADAMVDPATGKLVEMPADLDRERGIIVHLPVGSATVTFHEIDLVAGWQAAQAAAGVREWRQRGRQLGRVWSPRAARASEPASDDARWLYLVKHAQARGAVEALVADSRAKGTLTEERATAARERWRELAPETVDA